MNEIWKYYVYANFSFFSFFKTVIEAMDYGGVAWLWGSNCINAEWLIKTGLSIRMSEIYLITVWSIYWKLFTELVLITDC